MLTTQELMNVLLDSDLSSESICAEVPFAIPINGVFIVDLSKLRSSRDVLCDDMGTWIWNGSFRRWCSITSDGMVKLGKNLPDDNLRCNSYRVWKHYYYLKGSPDVKKMVAMLEDADRDTLSLIQYCFTCGEHEVKVAPHGNSRRKEAYIRTMPSVMSKLKEASKQKTPKRALQFVSDDQGGVMEATSAGSLPRSRQQVKDMRRKKEEVDPLFSLMFMCKAEEGKGKDPFVRLINAAPYPMMVLAYDYMLSDLDRFCTNKSNFCVFGVDPTFSLGDFDVTVTTYQHLMLSTRMECRHPTMIGPMFVHVKKDFAAYHFFSSSLIAQRPGLANLIAFGTDGETALANALRACFPNTVHMRCFLHFKGNIERKLRELRIPASVAKEFINDILGKPTRFQLGLVDAKDSAHLDKMLTHIEGVWNDREMLFNSPPIFFSWFCQYQREIIAESMVQKVRVEAGLGDPPVPYYTNEVESKNNVLKQHVQYKTSDLPKFVDAMKDLLHQQRQEVEKAVIGHGEYRLQNDYKSYGVESTKWFTMTANQRSKRLEKFMNAKICSEDKSELMQEKFTTSGTSSCPLDQLSLPSHFTSNLWNKAQRLSQSEDGMVLCPGDSSSWMVKSESGSRPHYVRTGKCGGYICDDECLAYKSTRICSHTVAVAVKTGNIETHLKWYKSRKVGGPNLTQIAEANKPKSTGKKRKGVSKKTSKKIKSIVSDVDKTEWQYSHYPDASSDSDESVTSPNGSTPFTMYSDPSPNSSTSTSYLKHDSVPSTSATASDPVNFHPLNSGTLQVNYSNVQIASGPPPLLKSPHLQSISPHLQSISPHHQPHGMSPRYSQYSISPPSLSHQQKPCVESPFWITLLFGNVSRCTGCCGRIRRSSDNKPLPPPDNLVLGHKEYIIFNNPKTGLFEQSREKRNVYYHPWKTCILPNFADFNPRHHLTVSNDVKHQLHSSHFELLMTEFGIKLV